MNTQDVKTGASRRAARTFLRSLALALWAAAGASGCASNVNDLLAEMEYGDPEEVKESIVEVGDILSRKESAGYEFDEADQEAVKYLEDLASRSPDQVVRACAISTLSRLSRREATDLYLAALRDDSSSWIVRLEGAKALTARPDRRAAGPLVERLNAEPRLEVRLAVVKALAAVGGDDALQGLLDAFLDPSPRYRNMRLAIYNAVRQLSGEPYALEDRPAWISLYRQRFGKAPGAGS